MGRATEIRCVGHIERLRQDCMTRRFLDLSITLDPEIVTDPPFMCTTIEQMIFRETIGSVWRRSSTAVRRSASSTSA